MFQYKKEVRSTDSQTHIKPGRIIRFFRYRLPQSPNNWFQEMDNQCDQLEDHVCGITYTYSVEHPSLNLFCKSGLASEQVTTREKVCKVHGHSFVSIFPR